MPITLVIHPTSQPALYGAMAAVAALQTRAQLLHLSTHFPAACGADAVQHVAAAGMLVPSGLLWFERLTGQPVAPTASADTIVTAARDHAVVVPWHPPVQAAEQLDTLLAEARAQAVPVRLWHVEAYEGRWRLRATDDGDCPADWWQRDAAGRLVRHQDQASDMHPDAPGDALRIGLVGTEHDQRQVYPATLACLADAADARGLALDLRFLAPRSVGPADLRGLHGVVLPGGSDMGNVPGQLLVAQQTLHAGLPTLGLCLGMQSMATAVLRSLPGTGACNLAEADPQAPIKSFVPLADFGHAPALPAFRVGDQRVTVTDPQLAAWLGSETLVRCNHRFGLNPALLPLLREHGVSIAATDASGHIVDAIRQPAHPFYCGMQGHPELGSATGAPHPLVSAFLQAAQGHAGIASAPAGLA